jgi:hypothetical protein
VERLIKVMPELAKESGQLTSDPSKTMRPGMGGQLPIDDLHKVEGMLKKHGYTFTEFLTQLTALVSTYLALEPEAFDKQLPSEKSPEVQRILNNPDVPQKDKDELKKQIAEAHKNKELIRTQVTAFATEDNKRVVRPLLARVRRALQQAEMAAIKARKAKK